LSDALAGFVVPVSAPVWHSKQPFASVPPQTGIPPPWHAVVEHVPSSACVAPAEFQFTPPAVFAASEYRFAALLIHTSTDRFWCRPPGKAPPPPNAVYALLPRLPDTLYVAFPWQLSQSVYTALLSECARWFPTTPTPEGRGSVAPVPPLWHAPQPIDVELHAGVVLPPWQRTFEHVVDAPLPDVVTATPWYQYTLSNDRRAPTLLSRCPDPLANPPLVELFLWHT
jgi:hypothetical protein